MLTAMPPSSLWQRTKRSPNTRVSSLMILKLKAFTYQSAVFRGSDAFRWMWLMRNAMRASLCGGAAYEPLTPSTRTSRERVVLIRSALGARYSSQSYQRWACSTLGNSSTTNRLGAQPPSRLLVAPPRTTYRPPYFSMVGGTSFRYSSKPAASVTSTSAMMYAGIGSPPVVVSFRTSHIHRNRDEVRQWDSSTDEPYSSPARRVG